MVLPAFSLVNLFLMLVIFFATSATFYFLSLRWTRDRRQSALEDWAKEHRFQLQGAPNATLPIALQSLQSLNARVQESLVRGPISLIRINTYDKSLQTWNILMRQTSKAHDPSGFRPRRQPHSFLDLFALTDFPAMSPSERFLVCATDSRAARKICKSPARGLLPADVGLIMHGPFITLDFSNRPFDTIEFERMLAVMDQILAHAET